MAKKVIKVNSNPNTSRPKSLGTQNFSDHAFWSREGTDEYGRPTFDNNKKPDTIKVNSNPVKGKTVVGPLARGAKGGGIAGLALGAISAYKEEAARIAAMKRRENRIS